MFKLFNLFSGIIQFIRVNIIIYRIHQVPVNYCISELVVASVLSFSHRSTDIPGITSVVGSGRGNCFQMMALKVSSVVRMAGSYMMDPTFNDLLFKLSWAAVNDNVLRSGMVVSLPTVFFPTTKSIVEPVSYTHLRAHET